MTLNDIRSFLNAKEIQYNQPKFIESDPISIPHSYLNVQDIEIAGFFAATLAWGQRKTIIKNSNRLMGAMGDSPHEFVLNHTEGDRQKLEDFVHRTFQFIDLSFFLESLQNIYRHYDSMEDLFLIAPEENNPKHALGRFREHFFTIEHPDRSRKHVSDPFSNSAAKRLNMFLRWMVRKDKRGVDFGIWKRIPQAKLSCPLDVHSGRVARALGLLQRTQNDWTAVEELDISLRQLDSADPVKYDFALFGLGVFEDF